MDYALRSVLIADDTKDIRELLAVQVEMMGLEAVAVTNGRQALEKMQSRPFDLVLLDIMMPELNGYQVLEAMNIDPNLRGIPVIVITAIGELESVVRCIELGAEDYMIKPFNTILLRARLEASLEKKRLREMEINNLKIVQEEQERSESLLLNILPAPIAERLKSGEEPIVDSFEAATVLFSDIADFTISAAQMSPTEQVDLLNDLFSEFDSIVAKHHLEKIKTIGDVYLLVAGLPLPRQDHAAAVATAALEMQERVRGYNFPNRLPVFLRIGIHTGPVVAGVIGKSKFSYDLWGDTVNTARRLEEMGSPGTIQISETTAKLIEADFSVERRGTVAVKGRGEVPVFLLTG